METPEMLPPRTDPDELMRRAHAPPPLASLRGIRYDREMKVAAKQCRCGSTLVHYRYFQGKGTNKVRLREPLAVCGACTREWEFTIQAAPATAINDDSGRPWDFDLQMGAVVKSGVLKRLAQEFLRSRAYRWEARLYVAYVIHFDRIMGRGGVRLLCNWASGQWPHAPFRWSKTLVHEKVQEGRARWAAKLARARIIEGGEWWLEKESGAER